MFLRAALWRIMTPERGRRNDYDDACDVKSWYTWTSYYRRPFPYNGNRQTPDSVPWAMTLWLVYVCTSSQRSTFIAIYWRRRLS